MSDEIETQTDTELTDEALQDLANQVDSGEISADAVPVEAKSKASDTPAEEAAKRDEQKPAEAEPKQKTESEPVKGPETKSEDESAYTKAKKEQERQDRSWKKLEEEKSALREEQRKIEEARKEVEATKAKATVYRDERGYSAEDYEEFSKATEDPELAAKAREKAATLRKEESEKRASSAQQDFIQSWQKNVEEVLAAEGNEDFKDENSEAGKALKKVLAERRVFSAAPDGIKHAVEFVKLQRQSGLVPGLEAKVKELETEITRLNGLTGISGSGPTQKPSVKTFDDMTPEEQDAELSRMAEEADRQGIPI